MTEAYIAMERQSEEIARLKAQLDEKEHLLNSTTIEKSKALQASKAIRPLKAKATKKARQTDLNNAQLELDLANVELKTTNAMQMATLAEQKIAKLEVETNLAKETLATTQHAMVKMR
ncbi:hypothetical protein LWI28_023001 [Acer negundo]|uniref:Uncharacterized protein n=1 Tax=Acer negundo TaxID=4023 RepID=A0AAD5J0S7_ACENE|nr:hypothetical protein LWI28_023001 [Acer negundo]